MKKTPLNMADMFCGAGGTSTGVLQAAQELGIPVNLAKQLAKTLLAEPAP